MAAGGIRVALLTTVLRISPLAADNGQRWFKVEGRLTHEFVDELWRVATAALTDAHVGLDVADITFADHSGARVLRTLRAAGVELVGPSEFVLALMDGEQP